MSRPKQPHQNAGQVTVHRGFRLKPRVDGIDVTYLRTNANSYLPRSFFWTDRIASIDLLRYIDAITQQEDAGFVSDCESGGFVTDVVRTSYTSTSQTRVCRASVTWLAAVAQGREPLSLTAHAQVYLRTHRNGLQISCVPQQFVDVGILAAHETRLSIRPRVHQNTRETPMEVLSTTPWAAGAKTPLNLDERRFIQGGYLFTAAKGEWRAHALISGRVGQVKSFTWRARNRWNHLAQVLEIMRQRQNVTLARWVNQGKLIANLEIEQNGPAMDEIRISPRRLTSILRGEDPLQLPSTDLCRWVKVGSRWYPRHFDPRLVDMELDVLHEEALAARARMSLPNTYSYPVALPMDLAGANDATTLCGLDFAGPNLLGAGWVMAKTRYEAFADGEIEGAKATSEAVLHDYENFTVVSMRMHWPHYGHGYGTMRQVLYRQSPVWLGWRSDDRAWIILARDRSMLKALETVCGLAPDHEAMRVVD